MGGQPIAIIAVASISILGNIIQFFLNKRTSDVQNSNYDLDYIKGVLKTQAEAYKIEKDLQENKIQALENKIAAQDKILNRNKD
jgi:competence protein ComGC